MITITVYKNANDTLLLTQELTKAGILKGVDYDFAFFNTQWDPMTGHMMQPQHADFMFYTEKHATLFSLKWAS